MAVQIINGFRLAVCDGYQHAGVVKLLAAAERMEIMQGGRLTDWQMRSTAAWLLGAAEAPPDVTDPDIRVHWLTEADRERVRGAPTVVQAEGLMTAH